MPYLELMSWDASKRRWHRMHRGVMYRVPASQLGHVPTREGTRQAANEWWQKKESERNGPQPRYEPEELVIRLAEDTPLSVIPEIIAVAYPRLNVAKAPERTVKATGDAFLNVIRGGMKPLSYREVKDYIVHLADQFGAVADVEILDEARVEKVFLRLRDADLSEGAKKKRWGFFKRYVKYLWERRLIDMPRNLSSHGFEVHAKRIRTYTPKEVQELLKSLKARFRLYALLGLNCGMTNSDIGQLTKDMIDFSTGTLTRRRVKTGDLDSVPTVTYKLWPETIQLLKECWSEHPTFALTSMDGTPLWRSDFDGAEVHKTDLIVQQWRRNRILIPLKAFRSVSATWLESHPTFGRYKIHFLAHSPKSIADRHYAAPSQEIFDQALSWLHDYMMK